MSGPDKSGVEHLLPIFGDQCVMYTNILTREVFLNLVMHLLFDLNTFFDTLYTYVSAHGVVTH